MFERVRTTGAIRRSRIHRTPDHAARRLTSLLPPRAASSSGTTTVLPGSTRTGMPETMAKGFPTLQTDESAVQLGWASFHASSDPHEGHRKTAANCSRGANIAVTSEIFSTLVVTQNGRSAQRPAVRPSGFAVSRKKCPQGCLRSPHQRQEPASSAVHTDLRREPWQDQ